MALRLGGTAWLFLVVWSTAVIIWEPPIKLWRLPQACTGSVTALKGPIVVKALHFDVKARGDYCEPFVAFGKLFLHTAPMESSFFCEVNFGIHRRLCVPRLFLYLSSLLMHFTF